MGLTKPLSTLLLLAALTSPAFPSVAVTAKLGDPTGNLPKTAFLRLELENCGPNVPSIPSNSLAFVAERVDLRPDPTTGIVSGTVYGNDEIMCGNIASTYYHATLMKDSNTPAGGDNDYFLLASVGIWDPSSAMPLASPPPRPGFQNIYGNSTLSQTLTQPTETKETGDVDSRDVRDEC